ncbi:nitroreductase/quinone reductase family protein [Streptomyces hydrogenans]|uniref:nitroreductase/quinone reductase family protein n=1 Tax=Streptomyces hydrogenans TaxID=1873719 RepID=UPI003D7234D5
MPLDFNVKLIEEFRTNAGRLGGPFEGWVLLLLTTTGARSGREHTTPLGFVEDGDRLLVVGSAGGSDRHPDWYRNVLAHPTVTVETGGESGVDTWRATAVAATGAERDALFARVVAVAPGYADYQKATDRVLPVVVLHRIPVSDYTPPNRLDALADELVKIHDWLRGELAALAEGLAAPGAAELTVELRRHCLTFCAGLAHHHGGEDAGRLRVVEIDVDHNPATTVRYGVLATPTLMVFQAGEPVKSLVGARPKRRLRQELADVLDGAGVRGAVPDSAP